jgi:PST family polysaccharide transporter
LGALQSVGGTLNLVYNTQGRTDLLFRWQIFASICYVASFIFGLRWGIMGVAVCYTVVWLLLMIPMYMIPFRLVGITLGDFFRSLWPSAWSTIVMAVVALTWLRVLRKLGVTNPLLQLISAAAIGAAVYIGLVLWQEAPVVSDMLNAIEGSSNPVARSIAHVLSRFASARVAQNTTFVQGPPSL